MALGDIWRCATTVRTFNSIVEGEEKFFEWVVVTHYQTDAGTSTDAEAALALNINQTGVLQDPMEMFSGNTRIVHVKSANLTSMFVAEQDLNLFIGDEERCLPAQCAIGIYGRGITLGRRGMKFYSSLSLKNLGENGLLDTFHAAEIMSGIAYRPAFDFGDGVYIAIVFGADETPPAVPITRTFFSPAFRTQRRRVLTMT